MSETPLRIRVSGVDVTPEFHDRTRALLGRRLARFGTHIERASVRFKDLNGPRGGIDTACRIKLTVAGRPSVFVEEQALDAEKALSRAATSVARAMARAVDRAGLRTPAPTRTLPPRQPVPQPERNTATAPLKSTLKRPPRRRGMIYKLEESATTPSRKSTRKSANRVKGGNKLARREQRRKHTPRARAGRAQVQRRQSRTGRRS